MKLAIALGLGIVVAGFLIVNQADNPPEANFGIAAIAAGALVALGAVLWHYL